MNPHNVIKAARGLQVGLDVLIGALVVLLVATSLADGETHRGWLALGVVAFAGVYVAGRLTVHVSDYSVDAPRGQLWPGGVWVIALGATWAGLLLLGDAALWIAFPLMFLQMHVLGPRRGVLAVAGTTMLAVAGALHNGLTPIGSVFGPVVGAAVAVGVVLGFEAVVRESQQRQAVIAELTRTRTELARAEREQATAHERERLAREIHDTLAQGFSSINLLLRAADRSLEDGDVATARERIAVARDAAHENLDEARRVVKALAPSGLEATSLPGALARLAEQSTQRSGIAWHVSVSGEPRELPLTVEATLLRIAQSAAANVIQHSGATRADLTLTYLDDGVALDVVDDGHGFDLRRPTGQRSVESAAGEKRPEGSKVHESAVRAGGFGLPAMRSRIAELGGTLTVESSPGERSGTALAVHVPLTVVMETVEAVETLGTVDVAGESVGPLDEDAQTSYWTDGAEA